MKPNQQKTKIKFLKRMKSKKIFFIHKYWRFYKMEINKNRVYKKVDGVNTKVDI